MSRSVLESVAIVDVTTESVRGRVLALDPMAGRRWRHARRQVWLLQQGYTDLIWTSRPIWT
jgi:hypothetical protein